MQHVADIKSFEIWDLMGGGHPLGENPGGGHLRERGLLICWQPKNKPRAIPPEDILKSISKEGTGIEGRAGLKATSNSLKRVDISIG